MSPGHQVRGQTRRVREGQGGHRRRRPAVTVKQPSAVCQLTPAFAAWLKRSVASVFHQGRTACCLMVACRSPLTLVHRWTVRTWLGSLRSSFCSSSLATNLARRVWTGSLPDFGRAVNERDLRTGMWVLRCWINPPHPIQVHDTVHAAGPPWRPAGSVIRNDGVTGSSPVCAPAKSST
jgi:hypothetical protein